MINVNVKMDYLNDLFHGGILSSGKFICFFLEKGDF